MWRCVGESCVRSPIANGKGMELFGGVGGGGVWGRGTSKDGSCSPHPFIHSSSHSLTLNPPRPLLRSEVMFSSPLVSGETAQTWEDWMKWEMERSGAPGSRGMSQEQSETLWWWHIRRQQICAGALASPRARRVSAEPMWRVNPRDSGTASSPLHTHRTPSGEGLNKC